MEKINIDLSKFKGQQSSIFTGRPQGKDARADLDLDNLDKKKDTEVVLIIPNDTSSFNPSFYLGLLYNSYKALGIDKFNSKYKFEIQAEDEETKRGIEKNLEDGMRNAINALSNKTGLSQFFPN